MIGQTVYFRDTTIAGTVLDTRYTLRFGDECFVEWGNNESGWYVVSDLRFA